MLQGKHREEEVEVLKQVSSKYGAQDGAQSGDRTDIRWGSTFSLCVPLDQ
jgi:hypothetical protein